MSPRGYNLAKQQWKTTKKKLKAEENSSRKLLEKHYQLLVLWLC